jgi:uncharacterized protein YoxC
VPDPLPLTLIAVLIILTIGMLATLIQIRRTARKFEAFLQAAQEDLGRVTADIHAFRLHVQQLVAPLQTTSRELSDFARVLGEIAQGLRTFQGRVQNGILTAASYFRGLRKGVTTLLPFIGKG